VRLYAAAAELESLYIYGDFVMRQCFPQTAEGEYLDMHAEMRGIERTEAVKARGTIRFKIDEAQEAAVAIPEGTVCMTADGTRYITTEAAEIVAGELYVDAEAQAETAGSAGNAAVGTVTFMESAPVGVTECRNQEAFYGGCDSEDDDSLRERVIASYKTLPNGANRAFYEKTVLNIDGVKAAAVLPKNRGLGTVDVVISTDSGVPDEALIDAVAEKLRELREICVDISVSAPEAVTVDIECAVKAESGYDESQVLANVKAALAEYFDGGLLGRSIPIVKLGSIIYSVPGVENYDISLPAEDVVSSETQLPVAGTITVTAM
jgi:uncharacterized phage protein gp47/JayE